MSTDILSELESELEFEFEDELQPEGADPFLGNIIGGIGRALSGLLGGDGEAGRDLEFELERDPELELMPELEAPVTGEMETLPPPVAQALMEVMAAQAAEAESEAEADPFFPLIGALAAKALPALGKAVLPRLARGVATIGRQLWRSRARRQLTRTLPTIARGAAQRIASQVAAGRPVSGQAVVRALAGSTAQVLRDRRRCVATAQRNARIARAVNRRLTMAAQPQRFC